jgi:hypothetical protein
MAVQTIPATTWAQFLDQFSGAHRGERATLEVFGHTIGAASLIRDIPLIGLAILNRGGTPHVTIMLGESVDARLTYRTTTPLTVTCQPGTDAADTVLGIESDDGTTMFLSCHGVTAAPPLLPTLR